LHALRRGDSLMARTKFERISDAMNNSFPDKLAAAFKEKLGVEMIETRKDGKKMTRQQHEWIAVWEAGYNAAWNVVWAVGSRHRGAK
jgi:hypothetical protein